MLRRVAAAATALAFFAASTSPALGWIRTGDGRRAEPFSRYENRYIKVRSEFKDKFGLAAAGRNIVVDGNRAGEDPSVGRVKDSTAYMLTALHPPQPAVATSSTIASYSGGGTSLPYCTWGPESGGDYSASNPSGAYGKYQIMPGTASSYGCNLSTPAGQDACAAEIYNDVGGSAWVNC